MGRPKAGGFLDNHGRPDIVLPDHPQPERVALIGDQGLTSIRDARLKICRVSLFRDSRVNVSAPMRPRRDMKDYAS